MTPQQLFEVKILRIEAAWDDVTRDACTYRDQHVFHDLGENFSVTCLRETDATRDKVEAAASASPADLITGVGHGDPDCFRGQWEEPVFKVGAYDESEVKYKVVHFFSCNTARELGPDFLHKGCLAFFGYDDIILYPMEQDDPDGIALEALFACDSEIDRQLFNWKDPATVFEEVLEEFDTKICELRWQQGLWRAAAALERIRDLLRLLLADPMAKLGSWPTGARREGPYHRFSYGFGGRM